MASFFRFVCVGLCAVLLDGAADTLRAQGNAEADPSFLVRTDDNVLALVAQPDGKVIIGGEFNEVGGFLHPHLTRLNPDGSVDASFVGVVGPVRSLLLQPDGKIVFVSKLPQADFKPSLAHVGRLNPDGSVDASFASPPDAPLPRFVLRQADGKLLVAGSAANGSGGASIIRLNPDGQVDSSYAPALDPDTTPTALCLQGDGKAVVAVAYYGAISTTSPSLVRFNVDGSRDPGFSATTGGTVAALAALPDGRLVAGGKFYSASGFSTLNLARFEADGTADTSFYSGFSGEFAEVGNLALQPDGKLLFLGYYGRPTSLYFGRLNPDAGRDDAYPPELDAVGPIALLVESDHSVLIAGYKGVERVSDASLFFRGQVAVGNGVNYLVLPDGNEFGYYAVLPDPRYIYHFGLGYEYIFESNDGTGGVYFYDFASSTYFYTSPTFPFPYLYDFTLNAVLLYYPSLGSPAPSNVRYFYNFATGQVITK